MGKCSVSEKYQQRSAQPGEWISRRRDAAAAAAGMLQGRRRGPSREELELRPAKCVNGTLRPPFWDKTAADTGVFFILTSYVLSQFKKVV